MAPRYMTERTKAYRILDLTSLTVEEFLHDGRKLDDRRHSPSRLIPTVPRPIGYIVLQYTSSLNCGTLR
jgi:hypothetical protein